MFHCHSYVKKALTTVRFEDGKYHVNRKDKWRIELIKIRELFRRQYHRVLEIIIRDNRYTSSIMIVLWAIFITIIWSWGKHRSVFVTLSDAVWDVKNEFFTSVIVVIVVNVYGRAKDYKPKLYAQHNIYVSIMKGFEYNLFEPFVDVDLCNYMPLYCEKTLHDTLSYCKPFFGRSYYIDFDTKHSNYNEKINLLLRELDVATDAFKNDKFIGIWDGSPALECIQEVKYKLNDVLIEQRLYVYDLDEIATKLYQITNMMRRPWRWGIKSKIKILQTLATYPNSWVNDSFYYSMLLYGHQFPSEAVIP